jgi:hypothetical protein
MHYSCLGLYSMEIHESEYVYAAWKCCSWHHQALLCGRASCSTSKLGLNYLVSKVWDLKLFLGSGLIYHHVIVLCTSCQAMQSNDWMLLSFPPAPFSIFCGMTQWVMKLLADLRSLSGLLVSCNSITITRPSLHFFLNLWVFQRAESA